MNQNNKGYVVVAEDGDTVLMPTTSKDLAKIAANTGDPISQFVNAGAEEEAVAEVADPDDDEPVLRWKYFYVFLFVFIGLTDGFLIGYNLALTAIFTENKVPSEKRAVLSVVVSSYILRMFVAPLTDKYYIPMIGKRKTYLLPCKLLIAGVYFGGSFFIESWVKAANVWMIALFFIILNCIMLLEGNAMVGFRLDKFGRKEAGAAASSATLGFVIGLSLGLQVFTALNSAYMCEKLFGSTKELLSHQGMLRIFSLLCISAFLIILLMKEKVNTVTRVANTNPLHVIKSLFKVEALKKALLWNFLGPTFVYCMKVVAGQYYIREGIRREDYIIIVALITIPAQMISSIAWIRIVKYGRLMLMLWVTVINLAFIEFLHSLNCSNFNKDVNYKQTLIIICCISSLEVCANWNMVQQSFFMMSAPKHYTLTYIQTINSSMIAFRALPLVLMNSIVDYVPMIVYFIVCLILQLIFNIFTFRYVKSIDTVAVTDHGDQFVEYLEDDGETMEDRRLSFDAQTTDIL